MKVILTANIKKLGKIGDLVSVKGGFARNYLFPQKKALSEMSVETIWQDGKIIYFNCVDRIFSRDLFGFKNLITCSKF